MENSYNTKFIKTGRCMECGQPYGFEATLDGKIVNEVNYCTCHIEQQLHAHKHKKRRAA